MQKNERSQWEKKLQSGLDGLITEMNRTYGLTANGQERQTAIKDIELRKELVVLVENLVEGKKLAEMYDRTGLGNVGYSGTLHVGSTEMSHSLHNCACEEHC